MMIETDQSHMNGYKTLISIENKIKKMKRWLKRKMKGEHVFGDRRLVVSTFR
ncbi:hypothetical protein Hanom_Chr08g00699891 [Helianthus anomalus]